MRLATYRYLCSAALVFLAAINAFAEPGVSPDKILIGQSAGFTGAAAPQIKDLTGGALAYFALVNSQGGIHGRQIVLESMDDAIDPKLTVENTHKLITQKQVFALFLYRGTPNIEAVLPIIEQEKVPLVGPSSGAQSMYAPVKRYLFPIRASYQVDAEKIIEHLTTIGIKKIAVFHEDGPFGKDVLVGLETAAKRRGLVLAAVAAYPRGTTNVDPAVAVIAQADPAGVVVVGAANASAAFIKKIKALGKNPQFMALSNVSSAAFAADLGDAGRGVAVTAATPYPYAPITPIAKEYKQALKDRPGSTPSYLSMEGYVAAKVLVEGLRRAGPAPTREKFVTALETLRHFDLGGMEVNYGPSERTGSNFIEITAIGSDGKFIH